ncbi:Cysteine-rich PDZ-binding protein [Anthophora plagiata]
MSRGERENLQKPSADYHRVKNFEGSQLLSVIQNESGGRKVGENKALSAGKARFNPYTATFETCRICRQKVHQVGSHYCQSCAYKKAICAMCGKKLMSTKNYKQSAT